MVIDYTSLSLFLAYLAGPLGVAAWMVYLSNAVRNLRESDDSKLTPADQELKRWVQSLQPLKLQALVTLLALGVPAIAKAILIFVPAAFLESAQPAFAFVSMLLLIYISQQVWFQVVKSPIAAAAVIQNITNEAPAAGGQPATNETTLNVSTSAPAPASAAPGATPIGPGVTVEAAPNIDTIPLDRLETVELRRLLDRVVTIITDREVPPPHLGYQSEVGAGDGPKGIDPSPVG